VCTSGGQQNIVSFHKPPPTFASFGVARWLFHSRTRRALFRLFPGSSWCPPPSYRPATPSKTQPHVLFALPLRGRDDDACSWPIPIPKTTYRRTHFRTQQNFFLYPLWRVYADDDDHDLMKLYIIQFSWVIYYRYYSFQSGISVFIVSTYYLT